MLQTYRQTDIQTYRQTDRQTDRHTYRPSDEAAPRGAFAPKNNVFVICVVETSQNYMTLLLRNCKEVLPTQIAPPVPQCYFISRRTSVSEQFTKKFQRKRR